MRNYKSPTVERILQDMNNDSYFTRFKRHWRVEFQVLRMLGFREWFKHFKFKILISDYRV
jgi:hypothetical protein